MDDLRIEPGGSKEVACECCGRQSRIVSGFVYRGDDAASAFFVQWTVGGVDSHGANFDLILGRWGEGATSSNRCAVSLEFRRSGETPGFTVIDASERPVGSGDLVRDAARQSLVTHAHLRSQACCALYCLWIRAALQGAEEPWRDATQRLKQVVGNEPAWIAELEAHIRPEAAPHGTGSGYVVDSLHSARLAVQETTFPAVIRRAVSLGDDTDTTAAIAGGYAGVWHGLSAIPAAWLSQLPDRHLVEPLVARLLESPNVVR